MSDYWLIPFTLAFYALLAWWVRGYSQSWQLPESFSDRTLMLRSRIGFALGGVGAGIAALVCAVAPFEPGDLRWVIAFQAALMAAAGASDLRRFLLPLPLTAFGIVLAVATLIATEPSWIVVIVALTWAALCIGINAVASKGTVQLGDHLAVLWIALAAPFNGMLAFALGTFANALTIIAFRWMHRHVAVAGAWMLFAAILVGLPPFYAWYSPAGRPVKAPISSTQPTLTATPPMGYPIPTYSAQTRAIASEASDLVAVVSVAHSPQMRRVLAAQASTRVAALAHTHTLHPDLRTTLHALADALRTYDLPVIRSSAEALSRYLKTS